MVKPFKHIGSIINNIFSVSSFLRICSGFILILRKLVVILRCLVSICEFGRFYLKAYQMRDLCLCSVRHLSLDKPSPTSQRISQPQSLTLSVPSGRTCYQPIVKPDLLYSSYNFLIRIFSQLFDPFRKIKKRLSISLTECDYSPQGISIECSIECPISLLPSSIPNLIQKIMAINLNCFRYELNPNSCIAADMELIQYISRNDIRLADSTFPYFYHTIYQ